MDAIVGRGGTPTAEQQQSGAIATRLAPVRTALVGYGYWGVNLARNLAAADTIDLVAIAEADASRHGAIVDAYPSARVHVDLNAVLEDPTVEAVVLATPAPTHGSMGRAVLESGRHVMIEKPLALTVEEADHIVELAERTGLTAMVGHTFLYSPPVRRLRQIIDEGDLGALQYLYCQRLSLGKIRRDCNALWNFAPHDVSIMLYLLGDLPVEVSARGMSFIERGVCDVFFATLQFPSGVGANLHVSWIDPHKTRTMTIVGDRKMAQYDDVSPDQKIWIFDAGVARSENPSLGEYESMGDFQWRTRAGDIVIPHVPMVEPLLQEVAAFGRACQTGERSLTDARHGRDVVRILDAVDRSAMQGGAPVGIEW